MAIAFVLIPTSQCGKSKFHLVLILAWMGVTEGYPVSKITPGSHRFVPNPGLTSLTVIFFFFFFFFFLLLKASGGTHYPDEKMCKLQKCLQKLSGWSLPCSYSFVAFVVSTLPLRIEMVC